MTKPLSGVIGLMAVLAYFSTAVAQSTFPDRPIKLIAPFPPGASTDIVSRFVAQGISQQLKVAVIVENKAGANGLIGTTQVAKSPADGYTLLYNTSSLVLAAAMSRRPAYDPVRDFAPVSMVSTIPLVYVVTPSLATNTIKELVTYAQKNPGKLVYASGGAGNGTHLGAQIFFDMMGINALHVPYKGGSLAMTDVIAGRAQFYAGSPAATLAFIRDKRVKALAVAALQRLPTLRDVPTVHETVLPGFEAGLWQGIVAPANTPAPVIARLNAAVSIFMQSAQANSRMDAEGAVIVRSTPEQYSSYIQSELERWTKVIRSAGITLE